MSGSHVAPPSHHHTNSGGSGYSNRGSHSGRGGSGGSGGGWKVAVLVIVLLIAIAALGFLLWQLFGENIMGLIGGGSNQTANVAPGIFTQVDAEYSNGKNVAGSLTINQGTQLPPEIPAEAEDVILLDISWTGSKEQEEPVYLTVSDPSFTDGDGLSVYEYDQPQATWEQVGTYRIANNAVTFQADEMTSFAFQVISSTPVAPTASPIPEPTAEPSPSPEPSPEPTPAPAVVMDYGSYPTVQTGAFTLASQLEDDGVYVVALVTDLPSSALPAGTGDVQDAPSDENGADNGVVFTQVDAPDSADTADGQPAGDAAAAPEANTPRATVLMNKGDDTLAVVEMPMVQTESGAWCLAGPITEGMIWTADRDIYSGNQYRFSLGNHERYLNTNGDNTGVILTDNHVRTRWLVENVTLGNGSQVPTLTYGGDDKNILYVSSMSNIVETLSDSLFPAGEVPAEPNPLAAQVTYLGTAAPADQTLFRETLQFTLSKEQAQSQQLALFKLDPSAAVPASAQTTPVSSITIPVIDENSDLSMLDIRDGTNLLQLGVDYTIAAKVYNNSTVVVVFNFIGKYTGQIVRTYPGTFFRTDASQSLPTASPEPTDEPAANTGNNGGGGGGGGGTTWVPPSQPQQNPSSPTDTQTYDDPTDG